MESLNHIPWHWSTNQNAKLFICMENHCHDVLVSHCCCNISPQTSWLKTTHPWAQSCGEAGPDTQLEGRAPGAWCLAVNYSPATWSSMTLDKSLQPSGPLPSLTSKLGESVRGSHTFHVIWSHRSRWWSNEIYLSSVLQNNHIPRGSRGYQMGLLAWLYAYEHSAKGFMQKKGDPLL